MDRLISADAVLVLRCQEGDTAAFEEIVARYKDGIYNYISRMISNRDEVEDLAQEVFVRAYSGLRSFRQESNLRTWLYRIANNLCIDKYRRWATERRLLATPERVRDGDEGPRETDLPDTTHDPQIVCERAELQQEVRAALSRLPDKLRAAILLYDMEGMSYEEIAEALGVPVGTVKSRLFNARMQLRNWLRAYVEA
ncbi:MAG: sigma-70 family RNA polymerase sigma factor [Armatimonadetes bacterium]|nr:sigma-70 family RNA polymerase sigma factor [Armatimonadota bacterium]